MFVVAASLLAGSTLVVNLIRLVYAQDSVPFVKNIVTLAKENTNFRQEIKTANHTQVVLMNLKPGDDVGLSQDNRSNFGICARQWRSQHYWSEDSSKRR
jgi:hypothetical protein